MTTRCAVLGDPISHSLSPVLHRAAFAHAGLDWEYDAYRVPSGGLARFLAGLDGSMRGLSLTMPLKREAMPVADEVSGRALLVGAANTLVLEEGRILADNTDLPGAAAALRERYDGPLTRAAILGGGATAASTGLALCDLGATAVTLFVRSPTRGKETAEVIGRHPSGPRVDLLPIDQLAPRGEVVVSTIPAAAQTPWLVERCADVPVVFEVIYDPWPTPLAASVGARVLVSGLDLLVHQAALQFEIFTGRQTPVSVMRSAGEAALAARRAGG